MSHGHHERAFARSSSIRTGAREEPVLLPELLPALLPGLECQPVLVALLLGLPPLEEPLLDPDPILALALHDPKSLTQPEHDNDPNEQTIPLNTAFFFLSVLIHSLIPRICILPKVNPGQLDPAPPRRPEIHFQSSGDSNPIPQSHVVVGSVGSGCCHLIDANWSSGWRGWVWLIEVHYWNNADSRNHGDGGEQTMKRRRGLLGSSVLGGVVVLGLRLAL
jgi:hypothetical protein